MNTPIIEVRNLSKTFVLHQQGGVAIEALSGISFSVDAGECVALHGPSGAGKSTLLRALYGNYLPTGGSIRVRCGGEDVDITSADPRFVMFPISTKSPALACTRSGSCRTGRRRRRCGR